MVNDIKQVSYNKSFLVFGLPLMRQTTHELNEDLSKIQYKIKCVQFRKFYKKNVSEYLLIDDYINIENRYNTNKQNTNKQNINKQNINKQNINKQNINKQNINKQNINKQNINKQNINKEIVFNVKPDVQNDIYHLYALTDDGTEHYYDIAHIPNFVTSVMMNKLFRNIKENYNLDALEESDEEEEFQDDRDDKFVFLDKTYNMICAFNNKFKKWCPIKVADKNMNIVRQKDLL